MITPGFFGFFNAHRGLVATQNALNTINHNISNANTPGYSRQRVDLTAYTPYTDPNMYQLIGGQLGQGPWVQQVSRNRDHFLDAQYRESNALLGMQTSMRDTLQQIEGILAEPSTGGVNTAIQNFFDAAQELSLHPESAAVRSDFLQQAADMITVFQQQGLQLIDLRRNLVGDPAVGGSMDTSQLAISVNDVNTILANIANLNRSIVTIKASGAEPNDLYDQRDQLLDELSKFVDVEVTHFDNGQIRVEIGGQTMIQSTDLIDTLEVVTNPGPLPLPDDMPSLVRTVNGGVVLNDGTGDEITSGRIKGIIDMGGNNPALSTVRQIIGKLDTLINTIVSEINSLQQAGVDGYGNPAPPDLFLQDATLNPGMTQDMFHWVVNAALISDPRLIAAGAGGGSGDGSNALDMAQLRDQTFGVLGTGFIDYFNGTVSKLGIDTRAYEQRSAAQNNLLGTVELRRQSIMGVNIDEEMIDMLRHQRAFEATSKTIKMFDEIIQTILNMT